jgi:hypothetical protein
VLFSASAPSWAGEPEQEYVVGWDFAKHVVLVADFDGMSHEDLPPMEPPERYRLRTSKGHDVGYATCRKNPESGLDHLQPDALNDAPPPTIPVTSCAPEHVAKAFPGYAFSTAGVAPAETEHYRVTHRSGPKDIRTTKKGQWAVEQRVGKKWIELGEFEEYGPSSVVRIVDMNGQRLLILRTDIPRSAFGLSKRWEFPMFVKRVP